jgi:hypothetical protein
MNPQNPNRANNFPHPVGGHQQIPGRVRLVSSRESIEMATAVDE